MREVVAAEIAAFNTLGRLIALVEMTEEPDNYSPLTVERHIARMREVVREYKEKKWKADGVGVAHD